MPPYLRSILNTYEWIIVCLSTWTRVIVLVVSLTPTLATAADVSSHTLRTAFINDDFPLFDSPITAIFNWMHFQPLNFLSIFARAASWYSLESLSLSLVTRRKHFPGEFCNGNNMNVIGKSFTIINTMAIEHSLLHNRNISPLTVIFKYDWMT